MAILVHIFVLGRFKFSALVFLRPLIEVCLSRLVLIIDVLVGS